MGRKEPLSAPISRKKSDLSPTNKIFSSHAEKERLLKFRELLIK